MHDSILYTKRQIHSPELEQVKVTPIRRTRLVDEATRFLQDMILAGKLSPGTRIRQVEQVGLSVILGEFSPSLEFKKGEKLGMEIPSSQICVFDN